MAKAIIFDVSGVLTDDDLPSQVEAFAESHGLAFSTAWEAIDIMNYSQAAVGAKTPEEMHRTAVSRMGIDMSYDEFVSMHRTAYRVRPEMIGLVNALHGQVRLFVLSNQTTLSAAILRPIIDPLFEKAFYSNETGMKKPDHRFFRLLLEETGLKPEECIFIDDKIDNVAGAWELGMKAILFRGKESLIRELQSLGISV